MPKSGFVLGCLALALVAGCAVSPDPASLSFDPLEEQNREAHALNVPLDAHVYRPVSMAYGNAVPEPVRNGLTNLRDNWRLPGQVINYALQGRGVEVAKSTTRFAVNTIFGLGGIIDPAKEMGLPYHYTNFDETFYRWGLPEGGYWELPVGGPGTQRDWTGYAMDQLTDPTWYVLPAAAVNALLIAGTLDLANDRYKYDGVIQPLLHESSDSYTATRIAYLQNMRARLMGGTDVNTLEDVYADQ